MNTTKKSDISKKQSSIYSKIYRRLHWIMALIIMTLLLAGQQFNFDLSVAQRIAGLRAHSSLGTILFFVVLALLFKRFIRRDPVPKPKLPFLKVLAARLVQFSLYFLAVLVPVTGVAAALYSPHPVYLFGFIDLSFADPMQEGMFTFIRSIHMWATRGVMLLLASHAGAALYHHFIVKDDVLKSMLVLSPRIKKIIYRTQDK